MPTTAEMQQAEHAYNIAVAAQSDARGQDAMLGDVSPSQAAHNAYQQVSQAADAVSNLQRRLTDATQLYPQAEQNQLRLHRAEKERFKLEASLSRELECCKLDCNYLPTSADDDGEVADSQRSEARIPGNLRSLPSQDSSLLMPDEVIEAGLTSRCLSCSSPAAKPKAGLPLCANCETARRGLTAKCAQCSSPIRLQTESTAPSLCERCSFACFRCGEPAILAGDNSRVRCIAVPFDLGGWCAWLRACRACLKEAPDCAAKR